MVLESSLPTLILEKNRPILDFLKARAVIVTFFSFVYFPLPKIGKYRALEFQAQGENFTWGFQKGKNRG